MPRNRLKAQWKRYAENNEGPDQLRERVYFITSVPSNALLQKA
jgi:hypothetical protein